MKFSNKKNYRQQQIQEYEEILKQFPEKPKYKYPSYNLKCKPTLNLKFIQNREHLEEALFEWKRKRAMNNRSVKLSRERKKDYIDEHHIATNLNNNIYFKYNEIDENVLDLFIHLAKKNEINFYIENYKMYY
tara:strand:+ start:210 stop:605 length:396 start_codon:yes stop_codon:yes gene_type:complete